MPDETVPGKKTEKPVKKQSKNQKVNRRNIEKLISRWPDLFCDPPKPLAIGIYDDLMAQLGQKEGHSWLKRGVYSWVNSWSYKKALAAGGARFNLDGESGVVSPEEQEHAVARLNEMYKQREAEKERRKLEKKQA